MFTNLANELGHHLVWNFEMISLERENTSVAFQKQNPRRTVKPMVFFFEKNVRYPGNIAITLMVNCYSLRT